LYGAENCTLRKLDQKYLGSPETWCSRRTDEIVWTNRVRKEEVLRTVKEERIILLKIKNKKGDLIGHILRWDCLIKHVKEGETEGNRRLGRKQNQF